MARLTSPVLVTSPGGEDRAVLEAVELLQQPLRRMPRETSRRRFASQPHGDLPTDAAVAGAGDEGDLAGETACFARYRSESPALSWFRRPIDSWLSGRRLIDKLILQGARHIVNELFFQIGHERKGQLCRLIRQIDVYLLPALLSRRSLAGKIVVVIDVLRATTTIVHALAAGAKEVVPCLEVEEARRVAGELGSEAITGGERGGKQIPGFDLGNSPAEYSRERVAGKTVVFTTTNGTRAMLCCKQARRVLLGAFVNFSAVCRELAEARADRASLCGDRWAGDARGHAAGWGDGG